MHLLDFFRYMLVFTAVSRVTVYCHVSRGIIVTLLTWPGGGAPGGDGDGDQDGAGLLAPAVSGHHREHMRPGLPDIRQHIIIMLENVKLKQQQQYIKIRLSLIKSTTFDFPIFEFRDCL